MLDASRGAETIGCVKVVSTRIDTKLRYVVRDEVGFDRFDVAAEIHDVVQQGEDGTNLAGALVNSSCADLASLHASRTETKLKYERPIILLRSAHDMILRLGGSGVQIVRLATKARL